MHRSDNPFVFCFFGSLSSLCFVLFVLFRFVLLFVWFCFVFAHMAVKKKTQQRGNHGFGTHSQGVVVLVFVWKLWFLDLWPGRKCLF